MTPSEQICCMALSIMFRTRGRQLLELYRHAGSASAIVAHADNLQAIVPDLNPQAFLIDETALSDALRRAEAEALFARQHGISILIPTDPAYPTRLLEVCTDAPLALYYRGNADLNAVHTLAIVGTRRSTEYGRDLVNTICRDLASVFPTCSSSADWPTAPTSTPTAQPWRTACPPLEYSPTASTPSIPAHTATPPPA